MGLATPRDPKPSVAGGTRATFRVFKTSEGELCRQDDPDAAFLAYAVGDQVLIQEESAYLALARKMAESGTNKMTRQTANKGA